MMGTNELKEALIPFLLCNSNLAPQKHTSSLENYDPIGGKTYPLRTFSQIL